MGIDRTNHKIKFLSKIQRNGKENPQYAPK